MESQLELSLGNGNSESGAENNLSLGSQAVSTKVLRDGPYLGFLHKASTKFIKKAHFIEFAIAKIYKEYGEDGIEQLRKDVENYCEEDFEKKWILERMAS